LSLAWSTLVVVVLLLPGVLFFLGLFLPERFSRDIAARNPLAELGAAVFVSFAVHGCLFAVLHAPANRSLPRPDLAIALAVLQPPRHPEHLESLAEDLTRRAPWVVGYVMATSGIGVLLGVLVGWGIASDELGLRRLARHSWVYDLVSSDPGNLAFAYVLTSIKHDDRILMYRGGLKAFGLAPDGRFTYLVLTECSRYLMELKAPAPTTTPPGSWHVIGTGGETSGVNVDPTLSNVFVIEAKDIANVVFHRILVSGVEEAEEELRREVEAMLGTPAAPVEASREAIAAVEPPGEGI